MLIKYAILVFIGLASGLGIAGGVFAFIVMIGVLPRLAAKTHTAWAVWHYENAVLVGGFIGNLVSVFDCQVPLTYVGLLLFGIFSGIYVGCFAMALAEVVNVIPIFSKRMKLRKGMAAIILAMALGKAFGSLYQLYYPYL